MRCNGSIELYTPQGAETVSGMIYEPYERVIMRLEHHLVGGYVRYISPHIIIIILLLLYIQITLDDNAPTMLKFSSDQVTWFRPIHITATAWTKSEIPRSQTGGWEHSNW